MPPLIEFEAVHKTYASGRKALDKFNLTVDRQAFVALLGPSGCGKSTVLRLIAGLSEPSVGQVRLGEAFTPGEIGFVFQEPTLMPWATAFDNVYLPLRLRGTDRHRAEPDVRDALAMVGLSDAAMAYPRELSGGMKMRVSIARALVTRPHLLLMDEPFAALDEITRAKLNQELLALWRSHRWTVVFVTHSVFESVFLAERIVVMSANGGRVVRELVNPTPYPRAESYRLSQAYAEQCRDVSKALQEAMEPV